MASITKRGDKWRVQLMVKGVRRTGTFRTKTEAKLWASETEIDLSKSNIGTVTSHTFGDLLDRYMREVSVTKKGHVAEICKAKSMLRDPISSIKLCDLRREDIEAKMERRAKCVAAGTVHRDLSLISNCLTYARRWRLMDHNPMADLIKPKMPAPRDRRISPAEEAQITEWLCVTNGHPITYASQRVGVAFLFAIETAMRAGEICSLKPDNIDLKLRVATLEETKNGTVRYVPLSTEAMRLLGLLKPWQKKVFGLTASSLSVTFHRETRKCGVEGVRFHDTRHEAITRLAGKLDVLDLARVVGHKNIQQLMTYYNKSAADIAKQLD